MQCRNCRANGDDTLNFCGRCGQRLRGSGTTANVDLPVNAAPTQTIQAPGRRVLGRSLLVVTGITLVVLLVCSMLTSSSAATVRTSTQPVRVTASPSSIPVRTPEGLAWFYDLHGQSDGVGLHIRYLAPPPQGEVYVGWLINPHRPDERVPLSPLTLNLGGELVYGSLI